MTSSRKKTSPRELNKLKSNHHLSKRALNNQPYVIADTKSYVVIADCVLEHIITTDNLNNYEKLYYLLADSLSNINKKRGGERSCGLASTGWAKNLKCSKSVVFTLQRTLQEKGYFVLEKSFTESGLKKRNIITPTIPKDIFDYLNEKYTDRTNEQHLPYNYLQESRRDYLDRSKLFIRINYHLLKQIISNNLLNTQQKIMWLGFYSKSYKNYSCKNSFSFVASYQELQSFYSFNYKMISKSVTTLSKLGFTKATNFHIKNREGLNKTETNYIDHPTLGARKDKSLWRIELCLPESYIFQLAGNKKDCSSIKKNVTNVNIEAIENNLNGVNSEQKIAHQDEQLDSPLLSSTNSQDHQFAKSGHHINRYLKEEERRNISNLFRKPKVIIKNFIRKLASNDDSNLNSLINKKSNNEKAKKFKPFSFMAELIREKLKLLPKDKADKARKFAYKLAGKKLATGFAASLTANELAKELIYHAATWKPSRLGKLSREQEIDTALTVAWRSIVNGTWQSPFNIVKAIVLDYEFKHYKTKYEHSGAISPSLRSLSIEAEKIIGKWYDLEAIIKSEVKLDYPDQEETELLSVSFKIEDPNEEITNLLKTEENTDEQNSLSSIDLSKLSEEQKYLSFSGTDTEIIEVVSSDNRQFYAKLKTMEMNDNGELVVTLIPKTKQQFLDNIIMPKLNSNNC